MELLRTKIVGSDRSNQHDTAELSLDHFVLDGEQDTKHAV
jgi:hypothetical protein